MAEVTRKGAVVQVDLRIDPPLKEFQFRVNRFAEGISDWRSAFSACGQLFQRQMALQFETEGAVSGKAWRRNEKNYAAWKKSAGFGDKVGVLTGDLRRSLVGGGAGYYHEDITKTSASYGMAESSPAQPYGESFSDDYLDDTGPVIRMTAPWGREYQKVIHQWLVAEMGGMITGGSAVGGMVKRGGVANLQHSEEGMP